MKRIMTFFTLGGIALGLCHLSGLYARGVTPNRYYFH